jgi:hypothetical protein
MSETTTITPAPASAGQDSSDDFRPIADYGLLADCNSAALVTRDGSVDWLCLPRYDSAAIMARILDPEGGHWSIRPTGAFTAERRYLPAGHARHRDDLHDRHGHGQAAGRDGVRRGPARA